MGWQDIVAIAAVIGAVAYLANLVRAGVVGERKGDGSSCGKCSSHRPVEVVPLGAGKASASRTD